MHSSRSRPRSSLSRSQRYQASKKHGRGQRQRFRGGGSRPRPKRYNNYHKEARWQNSSQRTTSEPSVTSNSSNHLVAAKWEDEAAATASLPWVNLDQRTEADSNVDLSLYWEPDADYFNTLHERWLKNCAKEAQETSE